MDRGGAQMYHQAAQISGTARQNRPSDPRTGRPNRKKDMQRQEQIPAFLTPLLQNIENLICQLLVFVPSLNVDVVKLYTAESIDKR